MSARVAAREAAVGRGSAVAPAPVASAPHAASRSIRATFLEALALHTDGIGWVHVVHCLRRHGVLALLARSPRGVELDALCRRFGANLAYLNVCTRALAAGEWLERSAAPDPARTVVRLSAAGRALVALLERSDPLPGVVAFSKVAERMHEYLFGELEPGPEIPTLAELSSASGRGFALAAAPEDVRRRVRFALDGNLLGPLVVALAREHQPAALAWLGRRAPRVSGWLAGHFAQRALLDILGERGALELGALEGHPERLRAAFELLAGAGWVRLEGDQRVVLTELGAYARGRALAYGVPVSYLPLFRRVDELLFGDPRRVFERAPGEPEPHVDRALNVRASGASHQRYFEAADRVLLDAFERPFDEQPLGFVDMGSGDGAWLEHAYRLITERTERGRLMRARRGGERYRPLMIGVDYNRAALEATRSRLRRARIPHLALFGDIGDPSGLARALGERGLDPRALLHGSSFLFHNRTYVAPREPARSGRSRSLEGAYAARGRVVEPGALEQSLVELFGAWRDVIGPSGMLVIELHDPERVVIGRTLTNYLLSHGLSDQLTLGRAAFLRAASDAGLALDAALSTCFPPDPELATVSVSHFKRR